MYVMLHSPKMFLYGNLSSYRKGAHMDLVYLSQRRRRRLWPIVSMIAVVGLTVTVQVTMAAAGSAHGAPRDRKHAGPTAGQILPRVPAKAPAAVFVAATENGD